MNTDEKDKNIPDQKMTPGTDPDRYEQGYGSFTESDWDKEKEAGTQSGSENKKTNKEDETSSSKEDSANSTSS